MTLLKIEKGDLDEFFQAVNVVADLAQGCSIRTGLKKAHVEGQEAQNSYGKRNHSRPNVAPDCSPKGPT